MQTKERINIRTTHERKAFIATAASYSGTSLSAFLLESAEIRAKEVMQEQMHIQLTVNDWETFAKVLDSEDQKGTDKARPKLKELINHHSSDLPL